MGIDCPACCCSCSCICSCSSSHCHYCIIFLFLSCVIVSAVLTPVPHYPYIFLLSFIHSGISDQQTFLCVSRIRVRLCMVLTQYQYDMCTHKFFSKACTHTHYYLFEKHYSTESVFISSSFFWDCVPTKISNSQSLISFLKWSEVTWVTNRYIEFLWQTIASSSTGRLSMM